MTSGPRTASKALHSARDRLGAVQAPEHGAEPMPVQARDGDRREQVVRVEPAEEAGRQQSAAPWGCDVERQPVPFPGDAGTDARRGDRRRRLVRERQSDRLDAGLDRAEQSPTERIVGVDHRVLETRHVEQRPLGARIGIHVGVVVEVIAAEVGECGGVDVDRLDATLVECMRRDFHDERVESCVPQCRKPAMNLDWARGRERHGFQPIQGTGAQRAHHRAAIAASPRREMGHARLAVRSGHRRDGQALRRVSVEARCGMSDCARDLRDPDPHDPVAVP